MDKNDLNINYDKDGKEQSDGLNKPADGQESRPLTKEEKAKLLAKNMASADGGFGEFDYTYEAEQIAYGAPRRASSATITEKEPETPRSAERKAPEKKKKKKKSGGGKVAAVIITIFIIVCLGGMGAFYLAGLSSYTNVFLDNTFINGVNVSGKTQAEAYSLLMEQSEIPEKITVAKKDGTDFTIKLSDIGYVDNTKAVISQYFSQQNHYEWLASKFRNTEFSFTNNFEYDKDKLEEILDRKLLESESDAPPQDAYIQQQEDGTFIVVQETDGDKVAANKIEILYEYVENALDQDIFFVDISSADCYEKADITSDMLEESCERLNNIKNIEINIDFMYTTETLTADRFMDWLTFDTEDTVQGYSVDEDMAMTYVEELAEKYDTYGKDRQFTTTDRGTITIPQGKGCYGWWIDQQKTRDLIVQLLEKGESADTEPIYYVNPNSQYSYTCDPELRTAESDYGDTYIEVDITAQHLWYYEDGELKMETDVVTGYPNESRETPEGVYKLWLKETDKTLVGESDGHSYASHVDYWNNISTISIGLHDADWQNGNFGGERYKSSTWGSHGCVNMPTDKAKYVYDNVPYNTPVFIYK